jgi:hypothetical protein
MSDPSDIDCLAIRVTWRGPFEADLWQQLGSAASELAGSRSDADRIVLGPSLPTESDGRTALLTARKAGEQIRYAFQLDAPPDSEPPTDVRNANQRCGGHEGIRALVEGVISRGSAPVATHSIHFHLHHTAWRCRAVPRPADSSDSAVASLCRTAEVEHVGYRLTGGANGIEEITITYYHERPFFAVDLLARGILRVGAQRFVPYADDVLGVVVAHLFERTDT